MKKIYVYCPNDAVTGGPDALHQLVYYLNDIGLDAKMVYYAFSQRHTFSVPEPYKRYVSHFILEKDVDDDFESIIVLPENAVEKINHFQNAKIFVWWLSVDNNLSRSSLLWKFYYFATLPARIVKNHKYYKDHFFIALRKTLQKRTYSFNSENENVEHICASYYAFDYVSKRSRKKVNFCIEPISKYFLEEYDRQKGSLNSNNRADVILYNPRKSGRFVNELKKLAPDLRFEALLGLTQNQLIEKYKSAKLYVDFGPFPGAERIPKEAVLFGCLVVTGRNGASNFYGDVPIPDEYKFDTACNQKKLIIEKIRELLDNYNSKKQDFDVYRKTVLDLEGNFKSSLRELMQ